MPRPIRIEYENAFYHVMNRGRGWQVIFTDERYYQAFLKTLEESHHRFDAVFHAYCLMGNHYHLLVETPRANLGRIMRHINGVYTQRYNQLKHTDGPLFRGRYKAILVDKDAYLLQLSRYIHRNPVETKKPMISQLEDWIWSSYPYIAVLIAGFSLVLIIIWLRIEKMKIQNVINSIKNNSDKTEKIDLLTNRQKQVFELVLQNKSNKQISQELFIELSTLKTHINKIYKTLNIQSRKDVRKYK